MTTRTKQLIAFFLLAIILIGFLVVIRHDKNKNAEESASEQIFAMDTVMDMTVYRTEGMVGEPQEVLDEMRERVYQMENELSVTIADSDVAKLNAASGEAVTVSEDTYDLIGKALEVAKDTKGAFDPTIYPIVKLWGFTTGEHRVPSDDEIKNELKRVGYSRINVGDKPGKVSLSEETMIDLGACAKGYLSDVLCEIVKSHKTSGIISLGGNVQSVGTKPDGTAFRVGIIDPKNTDKIYKKIESKNEAVVTSGNYERFFEKDGKRYHHIMDSATGKPADKGLASVTVVGPSGFLCDAYATAFFVMGEDKAKEVLKNKPDYHAAFIYEDGHDSGFDEIKKFIK